MTMPTWPMPPDADASPAKEEYKKELKQRTALTGMLHADDELDLDASSGKSPDKSKEGAGVNEAGGGRGSGSDGGGDGGGSSYEWPGHSDAKTGGQSRASGGEVVGAGAGAGTNTKGLAQLEKEFKVHF